MHHHLLPLRNAKLYAEYKSGKLVNDLSREYGLTINTIFTIVGKMARKERERQADKPIDPTNIGPGVEGTVEAVRLLAGQGLTRKAIAAKLGYSYPYVAQLAGRHGIKIRRQRNGRGMRGDRKPTRYPFLSIRIAADILRNLRAGASFTHTELARAHAVTREYVGQVYKNCLDAGLITSSRAVAQVA